MLPDPGGGGSSAGRNMPPPVVLLTVAVVDTEVEVEVAPPAELVPTVDVSLTSTGSGEE